jgi:ferrous iron transport protein B
MANTKAEKPIYIELLNSYHSVVASIMPVILGFVVTFLVAQIWRLF